MAEWIYEAGIGEARAALIDGDVIVEAQIEREDEGPRVGAILSAKLVEARSAKGAIVALQMPGEPLATLSRLPPATAIGARLTVEISRMALRERGRDKMARARIAAPDAIERPAPDLLARIKATGIPVTLLASHEPDRLESAGWSELFDSARTGRWPFAGGELWIDVTPAMTVIDVDGDGAPLALAEAGARAAAAAIRCLGIGGSIGIDFPTLGSRTERLAIDAIIDATLPQPFERTGVNGFGLMQIIRRRDRPSLIEQVQFEPVATASAALLRQAERTAGTGELALTARSAIIDYIGGHGDWVAMLQARCGRPVRLVVDETMKGPGHAQ